MRLFLFFFSKQKTAYEWRISDWSSDVCSSDLTRDLSIKSRLLYQLSYGLTRSVGRAPKGAATIGRRPVPVNRRGPVKCRWLCRRFAGNIQAVPQLDRKSVV